MLEARAHRELRVVGHRLGRGSAQVALHVPREEGEARVGRRLLDLVRVRVRVRVRVKVRVRGRVRVKGRVRVRVRVRFRVKVRARVRVRARRLLDLVGLADDDVEESSRVVARVLTGKHAG